MWPAILVLSFLSGCEELSPYLPTVAFTRLDVQSVSWDDVSTDFVFTVDNPNPLDISIASFDYALAFEGFSWLEGTDADGITLTALEGSEMAFPVTVNFQELYDMVQAIRGEDTINFNLAGSFGFDTPWGKVDLPYDADGGFPALRSPGISLGKLRFEDISLTEANLALEVNLDNDHASNILFQNFDYAVKISGVDVASGLIPSFANVDGATTDTVELPIDIDLFSAGEAVYNAIMGESTKVKLAANTDVDTPFGVLGLAVDQNGNVTIE